MQPACYVMQRNASPVFLLSYTLGQPDGVFGDDVPSCRDLTDAQGYIKIHEQGGMGTLGQKAAVPDDKKKGIDSCPVGCACLLGASSEHLTTHQAQGVIKI
ncbi:conserved hypothetical protein [Coccidioides posadasii str. Silveira]|uniref:Uncharacterized protein n=2 Tax=Coccidioides posadasii TaxID=199306 RepID=E9CY48_COCPS|nr:conserved hypothetical protein [Coccidioides posadasii str. Silveira]KMM72568.1 hypothetical protein CPAG_08862 [Coccidioides posadasii RMSCC 3488]